jgi:hypothetical protein
MPPKLLYINFLNLTHRNLCFEYCFIGLDYVVLVTIQINFLLLK